MLALAIAMPLAAMARGPQVKAENEKEADNDTARAQPVYEWYSAEY